MRLTDPMLRAPCSMRIADTVHIIDNSFEFPVYHLRLPKNRSLNPLSFLEIVPEF